ncbi:hypothetical protein GGR52DRAFT_230252 [Hypoxylon sp. FL1284]|nr:hypothetical protein GGR52DRAFT_230252 [Hypoxylon sp. FL1284]
MDVILDLSKDGCPPKTNARPCDTMPGQLTNEQIAYFEAHANDSWVPNIIATVSVCVFLSVIILGIRFVSRWIMLGRLSLDLSDWFIIIAWLLLIVVSSSRALGTRYGLGRHILFATDIRMIHIVSIIGAVGYVLAVACIKSSLLSLYYLICPIRWFHYLIWGVAAFLAGWAISAAFVTIFQCTPIPYGWMPELGGLCIDYGLQNLISGITNVATDIFLVVMVIPLVWKLHIAKQKKWLVLNTFAIASRYIDPSIRLSLRAF